MKTKARINANRIHDFSNTMFYDLYKNPEITWFGDSEWMKKVEERAINLGIEIRNKQQPVKRK